MDARRRLGFGLVLGLVGQATIGLAQVPAGATPKAPPGFEMVRWAREPMLRSPVALSFDDQGRLYVVETARRGTVDIDIRAHPSWIVEDLANQSVEDLRRFFRARMSPENSALNAGWLRDLNQDGVHDWRDLTEVKEKVHWLEDSQGTGRADRSRLFAEGFNEEISGVIAGVMPWGGDVFVTVYPDLWRLRDTDGDGVADRKESVFRGFGVHAAFDGHDLHGLTVGPEGKIYFSIGDNGFSVTNREGRRLHHPNTGGVLRMNPDGSELEVYATGLRNPQEIAFDEWGNLFTVDNDGDLADERERFVFIAEGSDSGWRVHWQFRDPGWSRFTGQPGYNPWIEERMWVPHFHGQPAHITPPLSNYSVGPGSFKYNPGTALNDEYRGSFFLIQFPVAKVTSFQVRPKGAGFEMINEHVFVSGMMASALNFSPGGALCIGDWDGMWTPSGKGSVWLVDDPGAAHSAVRSEVRAILQEGMGNRTVDELSGWLGHRDMRVRQRAQFELVRRKAFAALRQAALSTHQPVLARVHALWGLDQGRALQQGDGLPYSDPDPMIRAQAARVAGDLRLKDSRVELVRQLKDPSSPVRFQAALALGKIGDAAAFDGLVELLATNDDTDPFLRHAAVMGLAGVASPSALASLSRHASAAVRLAAVVALRRLGAPPVIAFLSDADPGVRSEAVRAIHDDGSIPEALPTLAALLESRQGVEEPGIVRRLLNANLRLGTEEAAQRLAGYAADPGRPEALRIEALECLGSWARTPALDRVQGFVRPLGDRSAGLGDATIRARFGEGVEGAGSALLKAFVGIVLENHIPIDAALFADWGMSESQPAAVRARILELLAQTHDERFPDALRRAFAASQPELRVVALRLESEQQPDAFLDHVLEASPSWTLPEKQAAFRWAAPIPGDKASAWIERGLDDLKGGRLPPELALDVVEAAAVRPEPRVKERLAAWQAERPAADSLERFRATLYGGDPDRGGEVFRSHANAQCVRCHDAGGEGQQVGPDLSGIGSRATREYLLEGLVQPSVHIADGFATTTVVMRDGEEIDGVRLGESDQELTLRLANGVVRRLPRRDIARQSTSLVSAMPPMGDVLTLFELRDLVAYLVSLK